MLRKRHLRAVVTGAVSAVLLFTAGCGSKDSDPAPSLAVPAAGAGAGGAPGLPSLGGSAPPGAPGGAPGGAAPGAGSGPGQLGIRQDAALGSIVTDGQGNTLYRFDNDTPQPPKSSCDGDCAKTWPPVPADGVSGGTGIKAADLGSVQRTDGTRQATLGGWPLYRYSQDARPGDTKGQGVKGTWFASTPEGKKAGGGGGGQGQGKDKKPQGSGGMGDMGGSGGAGYADQNRQRGGSSGDGRGRGDNGRGDKDLVVIVQPVLGQIIGDANGRTLYRNGGGRQQSTCRGECLRNWTPARAVDPSRVSGIDVKLITSVPRSDGTLQLVINGEPMFTFNGDRRSGDANGQGLHRCWSAVGQGGNGLLK
ncbi:SCO0930 family lipoprotein [Streptomyces melanogenes]|uniref:SCO0930 family lipoprotein n=1 Tax=Streptomyces melanogenes TaxID=67326 RepID=UPI00167EF93F|nr:SCO0930 family lipoprotein [Streptomyces melanogenes]GGP85689.1 hypothetical protein GCM10010278_75130 [Streptomyces melanogenes]